MGIGTGTALLIGGIAAGGAGVASSVLGSKAAGNAAQAQVSGADYAANLQAQEAANALDFQKQQFNTTQQNLAPYLQSGKGALSALDYGLGIPGFDSGTGSTASGTSAPTSQPTSVGNAYDGGTPTGTTAPGVPRENMLSTQSNPGARNVGPISVGRGAAPTATGATQGDNVLAPSGYGSLTAPWTNQFTAPTDVTQQNDPGYQFRLDQGTKALERSAAAQGNLLTGNTARDVNSYAQDYASNEYGNVYNRALGQYQQNYNIFENNQANQYNRLAAMAGVGQTGVNQLTSAGQNAANNVGNILLTTGAQQGQQANNAAAARASGYVGGANALAGGIGSATSSIGNLLMLKQLLGQQNLSSGTQPYYDEWGTTYGK